MNGECGVGHAKGSAEHLPREVVAGTDEEKSKEFKLLLFDMIDSSVWKAKRTASEEEAVRLVTEDCVVAIRTSNYRCYRNRVPPVQW